MELNRAMNEGIGSLAKRATRFYLHNKTGRGFVNRLVPTLQAAAGTRSKLAQTGTQVPPFLIASISATCNLHCAGCYARAGGGCGDSSDAELTGAEWGRIFSEAGQAGVSFVLLAGGEPLLRRDIIETAAQHTELVFPVFTNGTLLTGEILDYFDTHRNLVPVVSIEGGMEETDLRRGDGIFAQIMDTMNQMQQRGMLYGVSVTVTTENLRLWEQREQMAALERAGCGLVFFVEYVPVEEGTEALALGRNELTRLAAAVAHYKSSFSRMMVLSFPGDEEAMGGCLAAGRGFFHVGPNGAAEPCPFSPYSELNLKTSSLMEVLQSGFFEKVRKISAGAHAEHMGGCALYRHENEVARVLGTAKHAV